MQTITIQGYDFAELSESAKTNAANTLFCEHFWGAESIESIRSFCAHFGVTLTDYSYDTCSYNYTTDASNASFRGYTLKQAKVLPEWPTGYCMDCTLRENFISWFEKTGNALAAFNRAMDAAFAECFADWAGQFDDDYMIEHCEANNYIFDIRGNLI